MYQKCLYFRQRHKKGQLYFFCAKQRENVACDCYRECLDKEYKVKLIKKVSKKRKTVSKNTYNIVLDRCRDFEGVPHCQYCDAVDNLELHHVYYRSERKDLIDDPDNCLMLCHRDYSVNKCHRKSHNNKKKYQPLLLEILKQQKKTRD